jgi:hypothetical protein
MRIYNTSRVISKKNILSSLSKISQSPAPSSFIMGPDAAWWKLFKERQEISKKLDKISTKIILWPNMVAGINNLIFNILPNSWHSSNYFFIFYILFVLVPFSITMYGIFKYIKTNREMKSWKRKKDLLKALHAGDPEWDFI